MSGAPDGAIPEALADPERLLRGRGTTRTVDAHVIGCAISRDGSMAAFATGEGEVHLAGLVDRDADWRSVQAHDGSVLSIAADVGGGGFLSGGDDNALCRVGGDGAVSRLAAGRRGVEQVASFAEEKRPERGLIASASARVVELRDAGGALLKTLEHDATVSGIAFDARGKRLATSHYGGASLWFTASRSDSARRFAWKGSHVGVALHPEGEALVTAMQENELHGWRLPDGHNMRMSGYPLKTQSMAFSRSGRWLATSGADTVVLWPFTGGGPMGKPPLELVGVPNAPCTRVAFHPKHDIVAAGFTDGSVLMTDVASRRVLPVCGAGGGAVSALTFSPDGTRLAFGTEQGRMIWLDLSAQ